MSTVAEIFESELILENCLLGYDLNVTVIRGFAPIDVLAHISGPDVYDQRLNPLGTQRALTKSHAVEALRYALEAQAFTPDTSPRAFPEIILNARDRSVVSVLVDGEDGGELDYVSTDPMIGGTRIVNVRIHTKSLEWPANEQNPKISRLDGNHRLSQVTASQPEDEYEYPVVPFALFVGLTADQERALFRDINGTQKPMETAHLDTIQLRLDKPDNLFQSEGGRALWIAQQLSDVGHSFEGMVFFGGSKKGVKAQGFVPPIRINTLKSAIQTTLRDSELLGDRFLQWSESDDSRWARGVT